MDSEALVAVSRDGTEAFIITEDGFAASLVEGVWYEALLYSSYDTEEFVAVTDPGECLAMLSSARKALEVYSPSPPGDKFTAGTVTTVIPQAFAVSCRHICRSTKIFQRCLISETNAGAGKSSFLL